jgi:predicted DNA-binding transcriptional regulator AlpA
MKRVNSSKEQTITEVTRDDGSVVRFRKLLTAKMVCELLSISRSTLERHLKDGKLMSPTFYLGQSPRWADIMLIDWLKQKTGGQCG